MTTRHKIALSALFVVLMLLVFWKYSDWRAKQPASSVYVPTVTIKPVETAQLDRVLSISGDVEAIQEVTISAKIAGRVSHVLVENGSCVKAGQPLVLLEDQEFKNTLEINKANQDKAEAVLVDAERNLKRIRDLYTQGGVPQKTMEDAEKGLTIARADVDSIQAGVANCAETLRNTAIVAPFGGVVGNLNVSLGEVISPGTPLMVFDDLSEVQVLVKIEQKDLQAIKQGLPAQVKVDTYGERIFTGTIDIINPVAYEGLRSFQTKIRVDNTEGLLKPGMFATAEIKTGQTKKILVVPQNALTCNSDQYYVFIVKDDCAQKQKVEPGQIIDQMVEIKSGLVGGQTIVQTNVNKLKDGDRIQIQG